MTRILLSVEHRLPGFSLAVEIAQEARVLALSGPSGSGKTTLLHIVAGLVTPARGRVGVGPTIFLDTARRVAMPVHRRRIGYVFQDGRLFPHLTVKGNLRYGRWFSPHKPTAAQERDIIGLLGIEPLLARRVGALSGGERQRVAIGRALLSMPDLLLMDEPFAALDEARRQDLLPLIEEIRDTAAVPIIYVSHYAAEIARLADVVVTIDRGRVVSETYPPVTGQVAGFRSISGVPSTQSRP